jgi:hypothetical protein
VTPLAWDDDGEYLLEARAGNLIYRVTKSMSTDPNHMLGGAPARVIVLGPRGGQKVLPLGHYKTTEAAQQKCEQHYTAGADVSRATPLHPYDHRRPLRQTGADTHE